MIEADTMTQEKRESFTPLYLAFQPSATGGKPYMGPVSILTVFRRVALVPAVEYANKTLLWVADQQDDFDGSNSMKLHVGIPQTEMQTLFNHARDNGRVLALDMLYNDALRHHAQAKKEGFRFQLAAHEFAISSDWIDWRHDLYIGDSMTREGLVASEMGFVDISKAPRQIKDLASSGLPEDKLPRFILRDAASSAA